MTSPTIPDRSLLASVRADDAVALSLAEGADGVVTVTFSSPGIWAQMQFPGVTPVTTVETYQDLSGDRVVLLTNILNACSEIAGNPSGFFADPILFVSYFQVKIGQFCVAPAFDKAA